MKPLEPGTIVVIKTDDCGYAVRYPAIIRYWDEEHNAYEANVLPLPSGEIGLILGRVDPKACAHGVAWWSIAPSEIELVLGMAERKRVS